MKVQNKFLINVLYTLNPLNGSLYFVEKTTCSYLKNVFGYLKTVTKECLLINV